METSRRPEVSHAIDEVQDLIEAQTDFRQFVNSLSLEEGVDIVQDLEHEAEGPSDTPRSQLLQSRNMIQQELMNIHGHDVYVRAFYGVYG